MTHANSSAVYGSSPTARELEMLRLWDELRSARAVARRLRVSQSGIEAMLANVRSRAGVRRTQDAVLMYLRTTEAR